jgi:hypothetical protein
MSHHKRSILGSLMNIGRQKSDRMSWKKAAATGALVYVGSRILRGMKRGND